MLLTIIYGQLTYSPKSNSRALHAHEGGGGDDGGSGVGGGVCGVSYLCHFVVLPTSFVACCLLFLEIFVLCTRVAIHKIFSRMIYVEQVFSA